MIKELKELEGPLKQILYGCVEHVQATKAALYLPASSDLTTKTYEIVTSYQFNDSSRRMLDANDDLADALAVKRVPFFVNGLGSDQRFAEMLFQQGTDRLLAAPLFARGRMIGFIDMRDKAGKKPFERSDLEASGRIVDEVLALLGEKNLFGLAPIKLVDEPALPAVVAPPRPTAPAAAAPVPQVVPAPPPQPAARPPASRDAMRAIAGARDALANPSAPGPRGIDRELEILRLALPSALAMPGATVACLSVADAGPLAYAVAANAQLAPEALEALVRHLRTLLGAEGARAPLPQPSFPFGSHPAPLAATSITTIQSAPMNAELLEGVVLTVVFQRLAEADAQRAMQLFVRGIEPALNPALAVLAEAPDREAIARKLIEPDFDRFPDLAEHCTQVASLARRFALALDCPPAQTETIHIAALVHDVGLRLLDYNNLFRNPDLTPEQMRVIAEHTIVGAAIVAPFLGPEISQIVLRHHERIDGKGYPSRMGGTQIPMAARLIHIIDAWMAMTSSQSYQASIPREQAVARLQEGAGTQFDEQLVARFIAALPQIAG